MATAHGSEAGEIHVRGGSKMIAKWDACFGLIQKAVEGVTCKGGSRVTAKWDAYFGFVH